jgi:hypothetical protein
LHCLAYGEPVGREGLLSFRTVSLEEAIRHNAAERLYHPLGTQDTAVGIAVLRRMALDTPVYLVRLEAGYIQRILHRVNVEQIRACAHGCSIT